MPFEVLRFSSGVKTTCLSPKRVMLARVELWALVMASISSDPSRIGVTEGPSVPKIRSRSSLNFMELRFVRGSDVADRRRKYLGNVASLGIPGGDSDIEKGSLNPRGFILLARLEASLVCSWIVKGMPD